MVTYRTAGSWGAGKGSNLSAAEVDENFNEIENRIELMELFPPDANGISSIAIDGNAITIILDDLTELGPYTIPAARFRSRGDWADATAYLENDVVRVTDLGPDNGIYLVLYDHTSAATFDPDAVSTDPGNPELYLLMFAGGDTAGGGTSGVVEYDAAYILNPILAQADYTFIMQFVNTPDDNEFVLPINTTVDFPIGTTFTIIQNSVSKTHVYGASGVTVFNEDVGFNTLTRVNGSVIYARKTALNEWWVWGDMEVV